MSARNDIRRTLLLSHIIPPNFNVHALSNIRDILLINIFSILVSNTSKLWS